MGFLSPVLRLKVHLGSTGIILLTAGRMDLGTDTPSRPSYSLSGGSQGGCCAGAASHKHVSSTHKPALAVPRASSHLRDAERAAGAWLGLSIPIPCPVSSTLCPQPCHPRLPAAAAAAWVNCRRCSGPVQRRGSLEGRERAGGVRDEGTALRAQEQQGAQAQWHGCQPSGASVVLTWLGAARSALDDVWPKALWWGEECHQHPTAPALQLLVSPRPCPLTPLTHSRTLQWGN